MNVRDFCQLTGFRSTLILTWSFDAAYFERLAMHDLRASGTGNLVVLADGPQVAEARAHHFHGLQHLGKRYVLDTADVPGHFHPKLILRMGPKGGAVWISSGNTTPAGWGVNRELATTWTLGPGADDPGVWVAPLLRQAKTWARSPAARERMERMEREPWMLASGADEGATTLHWTHERTLAAQVAAAWAGRRFDEVWILTGSSGEDDAFLRWAHEQFGVSRARIAGHASRLAFRPDRLQDSPVQTRFIEPPAGWSLHAKAYWFQGTDGPAAIIGSANCSASAWLRPLSGGGNVELIARYDAPDPEEWGPTLGLFAAEGVTAEQYFGERSPAPEPPPRAAHPAFLLTAVEYNRFDGLLTIALDPAPATDARLSLLMGREELTLRHAPDAGPGRWVAPSPADLSPAGSALVRVRLEMSQGVVTTEPRWIDFTHELREASRDRRIEATLGALARQATDPERRRIMRDLQHAMDTILTDPEVFHDAPPPRRKPKKTEDEEQPAKNLDPRDLAVSLSELDDDTDRGSLSALDGAVGLTGVLHVLFPPLQDDGTDVEVDPEEQTQNDGDEPVPPPRATPSANPPSAAIKKRLAKQMEGYLTRMREPGFASTCTATQLVQAAAFPLVLATLSLDTSTSWGEPKQALTWAVDAVSTLLHRPVPGTRAQGLLEAVGDRYEEQGRAETFRQVLGDGLLWVAAGSILASLPWKGMGSQLERSLLLRDVFSCKALVANADREQLQRLSRRMRHADVTETLVKELPQVAGMLDALDAWLDEHFEKLLTEPPASGSKHREGDPLWRRGVGWVFSCEAKPFVGTSRLVVRPWRPGQFHRDRPEIKLAGDHAWVNARLVRERHGGEMPAWPGDGTT